mgnify:CR=1 FL=1
MCVQCPAHSQGCPIFPAWFSLIQLGSAGGKLRFFAELQEGEDGGSFEKKGGVSRTASLRGASPCFSHVVNELLVYVGFPQRTSVTGSHCHERHEGMHVRRMCKALRGM